MSASIFMLFNNEMYTKRSWNKVEAAAGESWDCWNMFQGWGRCSGSISGSDTNHGKTHNSFTLLHQFTRSLLLNQFYVHIHRNEFSRLLLSSAVWQQSSSICKFHVLASFCTMNVGKDAAKTWNLQILLVTRTRLENNTVKCLARDTCKLFLSTRVSGYTL